MDQSELIEDVKDLDPIDIYNKYLVTNQVWYFKEHLGKENPREHFEEFKFFISKELGVGANNITVVGSAKTCYSFAPYKNFKKFDDESDFDLVLVSSGYFNYFWKSFLELSHNNYIKDYEELASSVFRKFISFKNIELNHRHNQFKKWLKKVDSIKKDIQTIYGISEDINFRIYESWKYVESYHIQGIIELKNLLNE